MKSTLTKPSALLLEKMSGPKWTATCTAQRRLDSLIKNQKFGELSTVEDLVATDRPLFGKYSHKVIVKNLKKTCESNGLTWKGKNLKC